MSIWECWRERWQGKEQNEGPLGAQEREVNLDFI